MKYSPGNEPIGRRDENPSIPSLDHTPVPAQPIATLSLSELEAADRILRGGKQPDGEEESEKDFSASLDALAKRVNP